MGYNKIKNWFWVLFGLIPFLGHSQIDNDWPRFELYQLVQGTDSGQFVITAQDSNLIFTDFLKVRFADTTLILGDDTVLIKRRVWPLEAGLGIQIDSNWDNRTLFITSLTIEDSVKNQTGTLIPKGTPLYATGSQGDLWTVAPADASDSLKIPVVGIAGEDIADGDDGIILIKGHIRQVNTTGLPNGAEVYLKPGGGYTNIKPKGNGVYVQRLGTVVKGNSANGSGIINLGEPEMGLSPDHLFLAGADSVIYRINLFTVLDTFNFRDSTRLLTDSVLAHYGKNGVLYKYDTIRTFFDQTRLSSDTILQHFNRAGTLLKADTIRTFFDQTRLSSDSILQHFNQIGTLLKSDTIRLPVGATAVTFWDSTNQQFTYNIWNKNTGGNVGINTVTPAYTLDINGNINASGTARFQNGAVVVTTDGYLGINKTNPSILLDVNGQIQNTSNAFLAVGAGKVLIDTTLGTFGQSNYKLEVNGDVNLIGAGTAYRINGVPIVGGKWSSGTGGAIYYNDGNVGIGTATPSYKLAVDGDVSIDGNTFFVNSSTNRIGIGLFGPEETLDVNGDIRGRSFTSMGADSSSGVGWHLATSNTFGIFTNGANRVLVNDAGAVTIRNLGSGLVYSNNGVLTNTDPSDKRLKTNINPLQIGLNEVLKLNPVSFKYNYDSKEIKPRYGYIAQDVQKVIPDIVEEMPDGYLGLKSDKINVAAIKAIQELYELIQIQNKEIQDLKQELKRIKNKDK
jgi:hypothetical protein